MTLIFYGSFGLGVVIALSFVAWFQLRDRPAWDTALFASASVAMALLSACAFVLGDRAIILVFSALPSLTLYLWFYTLRHSRRLRAAILRWGAKHGYRITSLELISVHRGNRMYRIVARRVSDREILIGRVLTGEQSLSSLGFDVLWATPPESPRGPRRFPPKESRKPGIGRTPSPS
jgi:hypothetical protein